MVFLLEHWGVAYHTSRIYEILSELGLSHQKAHQDYLDADPKKQKTYGKSLKKALVNHQPGDKLIFFDEFAISTRPTINYAWAERNTKPEIPSREGNRIKINGFLTVDAFDGEVRVGVRKQATSQQVADFIGKEAVRYYQQGITQLTIVIDNNSSHQKKMKGMVYQYLKTRVKGMQLRLIHTSSYSPELNLAEYMIRLLGQKTTHHHPAKWSIHQLQWRIQSYVRKHRHLQTPNQIQNTINHIFTLISNA